MQKVARSNVFVALFAVTISGASAGEPPNFKVCQSTYPLCTTSRCAAVSPRQGRPIMRLRGEDWLFAWAGGL
jgi:hypothetical protein